MSRYVIISEDGYINKTDNMQVVENAAKADWWVIDTQKCTHIIWDHENPSLQMREIEEADDGERTNLTGEDL